MRIDILVDNNANKGRGEWGFSCLIQEEGKRILFDLGGSDLFLENAGLMGHDLLTLDHVVLSHGHWDHTWGLDTLIKAYLRQPSRPRPNIIAHPLVFSRRTTSRGNESGSLLDEAALAGRFEFAPSAEPLWLTERLVWLGEIERRFDFEAMDKPGLRLQAGEWVEDHLPDDSALAYKGDKGLVVITGCSHAGLCNIIEQAREICQEERVFDVVGGTHLIDPSQERMDETLAYLKQIGVKQLHVGHCTSLQAKVALSQVAELHDLYVGQKLT